MGEATCKLSTESDILNKNVWGATRYLRTNYLIHNQITKSTIKLQVTIVTGTYILSIIYKHPLTRTLTWPCIFQSEHRYHLFSGYTEHTLSTSNHVPNGRIE